MDLNLILDIWVCSHTVETIVIYLEFFFVLSTFLQDRSSIYTSQVVTRWFNDHNDQIDLLNWPSRGCGLNLIENVWANNGKRLGTSSGEEQTTASRACIC